MFTRTVTYKDFNGVQKTEDLYFHLSGPDMMDLQFNPQVDGDMGAWVQEMMLLGEGRKVWIFFKLLVVNSYGRRSEDGSKFTKKDEFTEDFMNSPAWEKFFEWLLLDSPDGKNASVFWEAVVPERIRREAKELEEQNAKDGTKKISELSREELEKFFLDKMTSRKVLDA